jgi:hypothetical protein
MNMPRKNLSYVAFFLAFAFLAVGYASLTDSLTISGTGEFKYQKKGVFIIAVEVVDERNA